MGIVSSRKVTEVQISKSRRSCVRLPVLWLPVLRLPVLWLPVLWLLVFCRLESAQAAETPDKLPTIAEKTAGMQEFAGFFRFWWDETEGRIWLEITRFGKEFLYVNALSTGLGSNPVGLDRGQLGQDRLVRFERIGPKVFLQQRNLRYRARTDKAAERRAVEDSFAQSVLWGGKVAAEADGGVLVDITEFLVRDAHGAAGRLKARGQNDFRLDETRSAIHLPRTTSFPKNTEFDVILTFESSNPGPLVVETTPTPQAVTLRQHHSFVLLPDDNYKPRRFDPRAPSFSISFADYATPIDQPLVQQWIVRHRLQKQDPTEAVSEPVQPIVYYVDPGAPEPVRSALIEGASWWNEAYTAAGFKNAFRVEVLPEDADPLDVRYNVIMWVHRSTRGWSYGNSVIDPRTGEILKGHVTLGSLRVRQDLLLMDGLVPPRGRRSSVFGQTCDCCSPELAAAEQTLADLDPATNSLDVALARIRQLAAHEVGHTLGFAHNFAASTYGRASVMDYPAPLVKVTEHGDLDLSEAYDKGIGEWDKFAVKYAYSDFPAEANEGKRLERLVQQAISAGLLFLSDADARPAGAAHPLANLWDNGSNPIKALDHVLGVRKIALEKFGRRNIARGEPLAQLEAALVPLYLHHRYQVDATAKLVGGAYYNYAVVGDGQKPLRWVTPQQQRKALTALLRCLEPQQLVIPERILRDLSPQPFGFRNRELFPKRTAMLFDPSAAAEVAARIVVANLLQRQRAARLISQGRRDKFDFNTVLNRLLKATWSAPLPSAAAEATTQRVVQRVVLDELIQLADDPAAAADVRALATRALRQLQTQLKHERKDKKNPLRRAHQQLARDEIDRFLNRPHRTAVPSRSVDAPPGSPIGN